MCCSADGIFEDVGRKKDGREWFCHIKCQNREKDSNFFMPMKEKEKLLALSDNQFFSQYKPIETPLDCRNGRGGRNERGNSHNGKNRGSNGGNNGGNGSHHGGGGGGGNNNHGGGANTMTWYHGRKKCNLTKINQLDPDKEDERGDFGQGVYVTPQKETANYFKERSGVILTGNWVNREMEDLYRGVFVNRIPNSVYDREILRSKKKGYFDWVINGQNRKFTVRVFFEVNNAWKEALWRGWVEKKRQKGVDMVMGYMSKNPAPKYMKKILDEIDKSAANAEILKIQFFQDIGVYQLRNLAQTDIRKNTKSKEKVVQLCCYTTDVLNNFT